MSKRIDDAVEVLFALRQLYDTESGESLAQLRVKAITAVAAFRGVDRKTIADIYMRRLAPYVRNTAEFDAVVAQWLNGHPGELKAALEKRTLDAGDRGRIRAFFDVDQAGGRNGA